MEFQNNSGYTLYWRLFDKNDHLCWLGNVDNTTLPNMAGGSDRPNGFKIEVRHNNLQGPVVIAPGPRYSNNVKITVDNHGYPDVDPI